MCNISCLPIVLDDTNCPCSASLLDKARCRSSAPLEQGDDDGDENGEDGDGSAFSLGSFRPGKVVWAKVDGHEWWPAKVHTHTHLRLVMAATCFAWCGTISVARNNLQHVVPAQHVSRACCGIMCAEVHTVFCDLHHMVTERLESQTAAIRIIAFCRDSDEC